MREVYSEVFYFIDLLDDEYVEKIPYDILKKIIEEKNDSYITKFSSLDECFKDNNMSRDAKLIIIYLYLKYWCETVEDLNYIKNQIIQNEKMFLLNANQYLKKYTENIDIHSIDECKNNQLVKVEEFSWLKKFILKIKKMLHFKI